MARKACAPCRCSRSQGHKGFTRNERKVDDRREILRSGAAGSLGLVAAAALLPDGAVPAAQAQTTPAVSFR
jgi:hypothetical protein